MEHNPPSYQKAIKIKTRKTKFLDKEKEFAQKAIKVGTAGGERRLFWMWKNQKFNLVKPTNPTRITYQVSSGKIFES